MIRTFALSASVALSAAALVPAAASAASYSAKLAVPVASAKLIDRDIRWACGPDASQGNTADAPAMALCEGLAKKAGRVESFLVNGRAFSPAQLDKCNLQARAVTAPVAAPSLARAN
jgi:hypothetical protein